MKKYFFRLIILLGFLYPNLVFAGWSMVYETDASGNVIAGNITTLVDAINQGANVKVMVTANAPRNSIYKCENVWTENNYASCMATNLVSAYTWSGSNYGIFDVPYYVFVLVNSEGDFIQDRWYIDSQTHAGKTTNIFPVKWFVENQ